MKKIAAALTMSAITATAILFLTAPPAAFAYSISNTAGSTAATTSFQSLFTPFEGFFSSMQSISPSDTEIQIQNQIQSNLPSWPQAGENILSAVANFLSWIVNWLTYASNQFAGWAISVINSIISFR